MIYEFFLNMWIMRKIDAGYLQGQVERGRITEQEKQVILASPQSTL